MATRASSEHSTTVSSLTSHIKESKSQIKDTEIQEFKKEERVNDVKSYSSLKKSNFLC